MPDSDPHSGQLPGEPADPASGAASERPAAQPSRTPAGHRPETPTGAPAGPRIEDFLAAEPTRSLADWQWLWAGDHTFPIRSHRGFLGRLVVRLKRWLRPLVKAPQADLWDRQRAFNVVVLAHLERLHGNLDELGRDLQRVRDDLLRDLRQVRGDLLRDVQNNHRRLTHVEGFKRQGFEDVMRHADGLYALVDQKLDRYRRDSERLWSRLGALLARVEEAGGAAPAGGETEPGPSGPAALAQAWSEQDYVALEDRFRGTREEIAGRVATYLPYLDGRGEILDLGCGRGEMLAVLQESGLSARGVDASEQMVQRCREQGLSAQTGDLFQTLTDAAEASLGAILSLHVIEHLPPESLDRLVRLAWRALEPGGVLILETPNPLSVTVAARNFWIDPTHRRPVHPATLALQFELAGFDPVERLELRPFGDEERLPEVELARLPDELKPFGEQVNALRDRLDDLLFGCQDYAVVGRKPAADRSS